MKKLLQCCTLLVLLLPAIVSGQSQSSEGLKILLPRNSNLKYPAWFDSRYIKVTPMGTYANIDIELKVSGKNSNLQNHTSDSLEIEYKFTLPKGSHIHAAWLWMNNIQVPAQLYEKKRAQFIYESLVTRNVDPLIIYKTDDDTYEARIFPLLNNEARRVKISIMVPIQANASAIEVPLPLSILRSDIESNITPINIDVVNNTFWGAPENLESGASMTVNGNLNQYYCTAVPQNLRANYTLYFKNRTADNVLITHPENNTDGYFQLFLSPQDQMPGKHFLFAIDHNKNVYDGVVYDEILKLVKSKLMFELTPSDSFNLLYAKNGSVSSYSEHWVQATPANIQAAFTQSTTVNTTQTTNLILNKAIQFNNEHANKGSILLITNQRSQYNNIMDCNNAFNNLIDAMDTMYPIDVVHVSPVRSVDFWAGNVQYVNNEYFLSNLSIVTNGSYLTRITATMQDYYSPPRALGDVLHTAVGYMMPKTTFNQFNYDFPGFIVNDYQLSHPYYANQRNVFVITGRYFGGTGEMTVNRIYGANGNIFQNSTVLQPIEDTDLLTRKIWGANFLDDLIRNNTGNVFSNDIVTESINYGVLTPYTAFLALEPDTLPSMVSNQITTDIKEHVVRTFEMHAVPNPFRALQSISVTLTPDMYQQDWECTVTDISGRVLRKQNGRTSASKKLVISWNGSSLSDGIYLIKVIIGGKQATLKVLKQE